MATAAVTVKVFKFKSSSNPKIKHTTKIRRAGKRTFITCSCMGYHVHGHCKHQLKVQGVQ